MKFLLAIILLSGIAYGGYIYYRQSQLGPTNISSNVSSSSDLVISQYSDKFEDFASVLGASIANSFENGQELLNDATDGASQPIINQLVSKTTETLKDLPRREAEKIKYEFCRGIVSEYENKSTQNTQE